MDFATIVGVFLIGTGVLLLVLGTVLLRLMRRSR